MIILKTIKNFKFTILLTSLIFGIATFTFTHLTFHPHQIGIFDFTITHQTQNQCDPNWTLNTVQTWINSAHFKSEINHPFQVQKTGWQTLQVQIPSPDPEIIKPQHQKISDLLTQELKSFNSQNQDSLQISNQHLTLIPAQNQSIRNSIFGAIFWIFSQPHLPPLQGLRLTFHPSFIKITKLMCTLSSAG